MRIRKEEGRVRRLILSIVMLFVIPVSVTANVSPVQQAYGQYVLGCTDKWRAESLGNIKRFNPPNEVGLLKIYLAENGCRWIFLLQNELVEVAEKLQRNAGPVYQMNRDWYLPDPLIFKD